MDDGLLMLRYGAGWTAAAQTASGFLLISVVWGQGAGLEPILGTLETGGLS